MFLLPKLVSILSAGSSSMTIDCASASMSVSSRYSSGAGEGIAMRLVGIGFSEVPAGRPFSEMGWLFEYDGVSPYGNSSSGIILVGGVEARPLILAAPGLSARGTHSDFFLSHT
jgi:hypothetical protein